jgi:formate hydrogenlyase subunit 4
MTLLLGFAAQLLHTALVIVAAPSLVGLLRWLQARLSGRVGPPILQPWRDLLRLLQKQPVLAESATAVTSHAPLACAAMTAVAACLVPSFALGMLFAPFADLLLVFGLLFAARCSLALAAADAGTTLGGIGASRVMLLGCLSEPALLTVVLVAALLVGSLNLDLIAAMQQESDWQIGSVLALVALLLIGLIDTTPQETLTGDLAGVDLALVHMAEAVRLLLWFNLIGGLFLPFGMAPAGSFPFTWVIGIATWLVRTVLFAIALAVVRTVIGRVSLAQSTQALGVAALLGLLAAMFLFAQTGAA